MTALAGQESQLEIARAKAAKDKGMTAADLNALSKQTAAKYNFIFDETTGAIRTPSGQALEADDPAYKKYLADLIKSVNTFDPRSRFTPALQQLQTPASATAAVPASTAVPKLPPGTVLRTTE
jgi:hypothetical protein